jgi:hypothetical protein
MVASPDFVGGEDSFPFFSEFLSDATQSCREEREQRVGVLTFKVRQCLQDQRLLHALGMRCPGTGKRSRRVEWE